MTDIDIRRQLEIIKPWEHKYQITIIGAGATGSRIFMELLTLGFTNIHVYDFDHVEAHNLANQAYLAQHVGELKVDALASLAELKTGAKNPPDMVFKPLRIPHAEASIKGYVFLLTDTMASRKEIYEACLKDNPEVFGVIETRMASTHGNVFSFDPNHPIRAANWVNTLSDDSDAGLELSPCGTPISVGVTACGIATYAVWQLIHLLTSEDLSVEKTELFFKPFLTCTQEKL